MQRRWVCIILFYCGAYASAQNNQVFPSSFSDSDLAPNNIAPDSSGFLASCGSELPAGSSSFDISSLISRQVSDSDFLPAASNIGDSDFLSTASNIGGSDFLPAGFDIWDSEDPQNTDDLWGPGSLGEPGWLSDLTMDPEQFAFNGNPSPKDRPSKDVCSKEPQTEGNGGWKPPYVPVDPSRPDHDCLDDDWEKYCCPLGIFPMSGTDNCVECKAEP